MKIIRKKICLLSFSATLFLCSGMAAAIEDGVCRVTSIESVCMAYTCQKDYLSFRFRWLVNANKEVSTNLAGYSIVPNPDPKRAPEYIYNQAVNVNFDKNDRLISFSGSNLPKQILYYQVDKTMDSDGNLTSVKAYFNHSENKSRIWQTTDVRCKVLIGDKIQYYPDDDNTKKLFLVP